MKNRFLAALVCVMLVFTMATPVFADTGLTPLVDYSDNETIDGGNLLRDPDNLSHLKHINGQAATIVEAVEGSHLTWEDKDVPSQGDIAFMAGPTYLTYKANGVVKDHFVDGFGETTGWTVGETFVYSVRLKNSAPDKDASPSFGMSFDTSWTYRNQGALINYEIENTEYETYSGYYTSPVDRHVINIGFTCLSRPYKATGGRITMDISNGGSLFVAKVAPTKITHVLEGSDILSVGETTIVKSEVFNQLGEKNHIEQDINWLVLNADRTQISDGATVVPNGDGTATVTALKVGNYVVLAQQGELRKGIEIKVVPHFVNDSKPGTDPVYEVELSADGDTKMGIFDKLSISAAVVDSEGKAGENKQKFQWYVINEDRTEKIEDSGINLALSDDTASVTVSMDTSVAEASYYIVAESVSDESAGMLKAIKITIDKSGTIKDIISSIKDDSIEEIVKNIETYIEVAEIEADYVKSADKAELASVLSKGASAETLESADDLRQYFERAALTAHYNIPSAAVVLFDESGKHNYEKELAIDKIDDKSAGTTLYGAAFTEMSESGKKAYRDSLTEKGFETYGDLYNAIKENLLLVAIANPKDEGTAYLDTIITEQNLALVGISAPEYFALADKSQFKRDFLMGKSFTLETLENTLKNATDKKDDEDKDDKKDKDNKKDKTGNKVSFGGGGFSSSGSDAKKEEAPSAAYPEFTDVPATHWACGDIHYLRTLGVINGVTETTYEPEATVTKEQFVKLIMEAFGLATSNEAIAFADVDASAWYAPYVRGAVKQGIITGKSEGNFGVGDALTRQDACVIIDRALGLSSGVSEEVNFADKSDISEYAKSAVAALAGYGIINGVGNNEFAPKTICTRAQAAKIVAGAISICNSLGIGR